MRLKPVNRKGSDPCRHEVTRPLATKSKGHEANSNMTSSVVSSSCAMFYPGFRQRDLDLDPGLSL